MTAISAPATAARATGPILTLTCAAPLLVLINYTAPMVSVAGTADALGAGPTGPAWMINGIALGLAALLLVAGSLADDHGRRRVYVIGTWLLALSSVAVATSVNTPMFVAARLVQGAASAAMLAAGLGIIGHAFPGGPQRLHATGRYGAMLGLGIAAGPLLSGGLAAVWDWRAVYWVIALAAVALAVAASRALPESRAEHPRPPDVAGAVTLGLGVAALLIAITEGRSGWTRPPVLAALAAAGALIAAFVAVEHRRARSGGAPMIDLSLFRRPPFLVATGGALVAGVAVIGLMSYLPTVLRLAHGIAPLTSAALFCAWSGVAFLTALAAKRLRISARARLALGLLLSGAGTLPLLGVAADATWPLVVGGLVVGGLGSGLINASLTHLAIESVPPQQAGMGSGANNTARYIGASIGVAAVASVVGGQGLYAGTDIAVLAAAALCALAAAATLLPAARRP